jgi:hypothetical protein
MTKTNTVTVGKRKLAEYNNMGVSVSRWRFDKQRVVVEDDGTESYEPYSKTLYLIALPGERRSLWLASWEHYQVLKGLLDVDQAGRHILRVEPAPAEQEAEAP